MSSMQVLGPTQPHINLVPRDFSLGVKQPGREDNHSFPSSVYRQWQDFSPLHSVQINSGVYHPPKQWVLGIFLRGKVAVA
jgi:hypothetical protein